ncbi:MAG TPA: hypothetical protein VKC35_10695 [Vicinamibacterales bacterium]|nr:hypothetical protein [Vicinamibacterales bacterium]
MERLNDWLQQHPLLIAIVGACGSALCGLGIRYAPNAAVVIALLVLLGACASAPAIATRLNRLHQGRRAAEDCLKRLLHACGHSFGYPERHVRVNIMRFSADRRRRKVHPATAFNMGNDPDSDLEIDATAGASGQAAVNRRPAFADLSLQLQPGGPEWGLRNHEKAKVRQSLRSILSVPVFNPSDPDGELFATLQIDSDLSVIEIGFDQEQAWRRAERFADVVSLLLEPGR